MKDYRLSEIKEICEKMHNEFGENACINCENNGLGDFCTVEFENYPTDWYVDVEPRDMIELPCKIPMIAINEQVLSWQVAYRSVLGTGDIRTRLFDTESETDAFLAELKGGKR